jgi:hypothetical protein
MTTLTCSLAGHRTQTIPVADQCTLIQPDALERSSCPIEMLALMLGGSGTEQRTPVVLSRWIEMLALVDKDREWGSPNETLAQELNLRFTTQTSRFQTPGAPVRPDNQVFI